MNAISTWVSLPELAAQLRHACTRGSRGSFIVATANNDLISIAVCEGQISGLRFRTTRGAAALPLLQKVGQCKAQFKDDRGVFTDDDLPTTDQILSTLGDGAAAAPAAALEQSTDKAWVLIEEEVGKVFGPVAKLLCQEQIARGDRLRSLDDIRRVLKAIAVAGGEPGLAAGLIDQVIRRSDKTRG